MFLSPVGLRRKGVGVRRIARRAQITQKSLAGTRVFQNPSGGELVFASAMREVFGERGTPTHGAARAIKPTEVGDAARQLNRDKTLVNKGRGDTRGCPHRGDRRGDRVNEPLQRALSEKKGSSRLVKTHHPPLPVAADVNPLKLLP